MGRNQQNMDEANRFGGHQRTGFQSQKAGLKPVGGDEVGELNRRLDEHSELLLRDSRENAKLSRAAVDARNVYDVAKAKETLKVRIECKGWTVDEKKAQVLLRCEPQMIEARITEAHLDAMKTRLRSVEASLSAVQTKARLLKTEADLGGYKT